MVELLKEVIRLRKEYEDYLIKVCGIPKSVVENVNRRRRKIMSEEIEKAKQWYAREAFRK